MWKFGTIFIMLAVAFTTHRYHRSKERMCNNTHIKKLTKTEEMQKRMSGVHSDISLKKSTLNNVINKQSQWTYHLAGKTITYNSYSPKICLITHSDNNNNHRWLSFSHVSSLAFIIT